MMSLKDTLTKKTDSIPEIVYEGDFRILNKNATPIEKVGNLYKPKDASEIECLEYQVTQSRISKRVL